MRAKSEISEWNVATHYINFYVLCFLFLCQACVRLIDYSLACMSVYRAISVPYNLYFLFGKLLPTTQHKACQINSYERGYAVLTLLIPGGGAGDNVPLPVFSGTI